MSMHLERILCLICFLALCSVQKAGMFFLKSSPPITASSGITMGDGPGYWKFDYLVESRACISSSRKFPVHVLRLRGGRSKRGGKRVREAILSSGKAAAARFPIGDWRIKASWAFHQDYHIPDNNTHTHTHTHTHTLLRAKVLNTVQAGSWV